MGRPSAETPTPSENPLAEELRDLGFGGLMV